MSEVRKRGPAEKYTWFFLDFNSAWGISLLFALLVIALVIGLFILYCYLGNDIAPDSVVGYAYAIVGTLFMLFAALGYNSYRRSRKRRIGQLNGALHWHSSFGLIALGLLLLHSFGNFNPRSGTYALYSLIALVISGIVGRVLDRVVPKLVANDVRRMLANGSEDRVALHSRIIQSTVSDGDQELPYLELQKDTTQPEITRVRRPSTTPLDLGYLSLEEIPQKLGWYEQRHRPILGRESDLAKPETLMPDVEGVSSAEGVFNREVYYKAIIRYWRVVHTILAFITFGLTLWHLEYVATLLFPMFFRYVAG